MEIVQIIFWLLVIDSIIANIISWTHYANDINKYWFIRRHLPMTRGWTVWYFVLSLYIGYLVYSA